MSRYLLRRIEETPTIQIRTRTEIVALEGNGHLERVHWRDGTGAVTSPYLLETSLPGVFAVGDVRCGNIKRVASAVGEGSIAVSFVHRVLAE